MENKTGQNMMNSDVNKMEAGPLSSQETMQGVTTMRAAETILPVPAMSSEIERLYRDHHQMILRTAYRVTRDLRDAEDVLHSLFIRLMQRETGLDPALNPGPYLHRAAVNQALDILRKRQRNVSMEVVSPARQQEDPLPDEASGHSELGDRLREAIARLSPRMGEMFILRYVEGYSNSEIGHMMGISWSVVAVTLHRARRRLQKELQS